MSNFKQYISDLHKVGYLAKSSCENLIEKYNKSTDEYKEAYDRMPKLVVEKYLRNRDYNKVIPMEENIKSLKNNVQFMAWLLIFTIIVQVIIWVSANV